MKKMVLAVCLAAALEGSLTQANTLAPQSTQQSAAADGAGSSKVTQTVQPASSMLQERELQCDVEAKCLAKLRGIARRNGKNLILKLDNGSAKSFQSTDECDIVGETCNQTSLVSYWPSPRLFVLLERTYEGFASIVVNQRDGAIFRIVAAEPHLSPNGKRFVVVAAREQDSINEVAIYRADIFPPVLEWRHRPKSIETMYQFVGWSGNGQVKLKTFEQKTEANVSRTGAGWKLEPAKH